MKNYSYATRNILYYFEVTMRGKYKRDDEAIKRLAVRVRMYRQELDLTMTELAEKADMDYRQLAYMELGNVDSSLTKIVAVAKALGVKAGQLIDE